MPYLKRSDASVFFDDTSGRGEPIVTLHGFIENGSYEIPVRPFFSASGSEK